MYKAVQLLLDESRGHYIPQKFAENFRDWLGIHEEDRAILLQGQSHPEYWAAWEIVQECAYWREDGKTWHLWHDGDLWAYCFDLMTQEEKTNLFGV